jgi:thiazole/oxazole-forming peptide maturase SagD family component
MRIFRRVYLLDWSAAFWADAGARFLECLLGSQDTPVQFLAAKHLWKGPATAATHFFTPREERWLSRQIERWQAGSKSPSVALLDPIRRKVIASYRLTDPWDAEALFRPGGPCLSVEEMKFAGGARPFHVTFVNSGVTAAQLLNDWPICVSSGRSEDSKAAGVKASVEAFERWINGFVVASRLVRGSLEEIGPSAVDPRHIVAYASWQYRRRGFPYHRFDKRRSVYWVKGQSMADGGDRYVLADAIFYPFPYTTRPYTFATSSGSAAHLTKSQAEDSALAELVERDAFMAHWLLRKPPRPIKHESLPEELQGVIRECRDRDWDVKLFDMTIETGVVLLALASHRDATQGWLLGSACSWHDPLAAAHHALDEVRLATLLHQADVPHKACAPHEVRSLYDHYRLYRSRKMQESASFLFQGPPIRFMDLAGKGDAASLREGLSLSTESSISVDLTEQLPFAPPYAAVKVIVPGLLPISFGYCREPFGMTRLTTLARLFGLRRTSPTSPDTTPHPFI